MLKITKAGMGTFHLNPFAEMPLRREGDGCQEIKGIRKCLQSFAGGCAPLESELSPAHGAGLTYEVGRMLVWYSGKAVACVGGPRRAGDSGVCQAFTLSSLPLPPSRS